MRDRGIWLAAAISLIATAAIAPAAQTQPAPASGPALPPGFVVKHLDTGEAAARQYIVFAPQRYRPDRKWPVLIFLHGSGESGTNTIRQTVVGLGPYIAARRLDDFPFVTIFPQVPPGPRVLENFLGEHGDWVWRMLETVQTEYRTDPNRVYLTGLSMGGFGTWDLAMEHPDRLAAIMPLCGGSAHPQLLSNLASMPIWAFHGARDDRVPVRRTRDLIHALRAAGADPRYTEYPELMHNCWDRTYQNPAIYDWLLSHKRIDKPARIAYTLPRAATMPWRVWWFEFEEVEAMSGRGHAHAACDIKPDGQVEIVTEGVVQASLNVADMPVSQEQPLHVTWNGRVVFDGAAPANRRVPLTPASQPATR